MRGAREQTRESSVVSQRASRADDQVSALDPLLDLQHSVGNQALLHLLAAGRVQAKHKGSAGTSGLLVQRKCASCAMGAPCSECEDEEEKRGLFKSSGLMVQRAAREGTGSKPAGAQTEASPAPANARPALIVEDDSEVKTGQMRKSEFLSQLRTAVCSTAEQALAGTMWSVQGCPYIERWLDHYSKQPSSHLERALRKYAPETATARSAAEYIPHVTQRLRRGIEEWRSTGEVPELPQELAGEEMPGMTAAGLLGGLFSAAGSAIAGLVGGAGRALSNVGKMLFKHREGSDSETADPVTIRAQLGSGSALDGKVAGRMKTAFGSDFSSVRVHTDAKAQTLNESLNARAFTIGTDIAFAAGEYRPSTLIGDALIAHELAHVVQQSGGKTSSGPMQMGGAEPSSLEEDADIAAVGAMTSLWGGRLGNFKAMGRRALPSLRAGLKLQRCPASQTPAPKPPTTVPTTPTGPTTTPTGPTTTQTGPSTAQPATGQGVITEELGSAHCDPDQGKKVFKLDAGKIPICMIDCAREHELAHVTFDKECPKLGEIWKRVNEAIAEAEAAAAGTDRPKAQAAVDKATKVVAEWEKAVTDYEEWHKRTLCENETQAYQAGIDKCKEKKVVDECAALKETAQYQKLMNDWEKFKKNPPNCK